MSHDRTFKPRQNFKGAFGGSGYALMGLPEVRDTILKMIPKEPAQVKVLYLGTATYDSDEGCEKQAKAYSDIGCTLVRLNVASSSPNPEEIATKFDSVDVVLVSGGNTLYAIDRWARLGIDKQLRLAMERGAVLCGGSAGAICWFDAGHSDSMDPTTYHPTVAAISPGQWKYIRVPGLGFVPGLLCPHLDRTQSNGILRSVDFDEMLKRHPGERGIGIDHFALLVVDGESYRTLSFQGDARVWIKEVLEDGTIRSTVAPPEGRVEDLFLNSSAIKTDPLTETCRQQNPSDTF